MRKLEDMLTWAVVAVIAILVIVVLVGVVAHYRDCQAVGGVLVRGLFGYECMSR
jgi:uncharacterized membrane protein